MREKVFCHQCTKYHGFGWIRNHQGKQIKKAHRCYQGGFLSNYVTGALIPYYENCEDRTRNKWGNCTQWKPKWIIRLLMWRPRWLRTAVWPWHSSLSSSRMIPDGRITFDWRYKGARLMWDFASNMITIHAERLRFWTSLSSVDIMRLTRTWNTTRT